MQSNNEKKECEYCDCAVPLNRCGHCQAYCKPSMSRQPQNEAKERHCNLLATYECEGCNYTSSCRYDIIQTTNGITRCKHCNRIFDN